MPATRRTSAPTNSPASPWRRSSRRRRGRRKRKRRPLRQEAWRKAESQEEALADVEGPRSSKLLQNLRSSRLDRLARRSLDIERAHLAVLDDHGKSFRAHAEPAAGHIGFQSERLDEAAIAVRQEG